ncbi:NudC-like protein [Cryptosporidium canis]|uniref:Nuclear migration protein nudC n=1 Tax=Cryptosporidium canis TaxID=195482 RepID=A0ABQ8P9W1_9CRYT|nr:NudC-like protein [Cryptosporidium canis]KAJ1614128.1 NudC-like protein [Cryptosporidium canis]
MDERFDSLLINVAQSANGIENFLDVIFGFLLRKTDFFTAMSQGEEEEILMKYFKKYQALSADKRREEKRLMMEREEERKKKIQEQKKKEEEEIKSKSSKSTPKVEEVFSDDENDTSKTKIDGEAKHENESDSEAPPPGNGGSTEKYTWTQTLGAVEMLISTLPGLKSKDCNINIGTSKLKVVVRGEVIIDGEFSSKVRPDECLWSIVDGKTIQIVLEKQEQINWWPCVIKGDPEIDTTKIVPENSKLSDLDPETRATVEKMMFDQRQKAMGLPTSDNLKQHELLEKFKAAHPEMDFSQAKINYGSGF